MTVQELFKSLDKEDFIKYYCQYEDVLAGKYEVTEKGKITAQKVMDYDEIWDSKIKEIIGNNEYDNFKNTLRKISEELI